ncbi:hypothetical protein LINGRAHAP2_LOCUS8664 [Linum grandiflorum]
MQHTDSRAKSLQAVCDSAEASSSNCRLLSSPLACRFPVPLLVQEVSFDPFSWHQCSSCGAAPC